MTAQPIPELGPSTALIGLVPRVEPDRRAARRARARRERSRKRMGPVLPLVVASTMTITSSIAVVTPAHADEVRKDPHRAKPPVTDRGKTVREAFLEAKRAAQAAAQAIRTTLKPPATYTVVEGDTLAAIAQRFDIPLASLLALNGLSWSSDVHPGQLIKLTASGKKPQPVEPEPEPEPVPQEQRHTVAAGESLAAIAQQYGIDVAWILSANGLSWSSIIYPGQQVIIPAGAPTAPIPAEPAPAAADEPAPAPEPEPEAPALEAPAGDVVPLTDEMRQNAEIIIRVGREMGVSDYGIVIALATAAQESTLRNLDWGDRDSVGLFQQRPSQGWGTVEELTDPVHASLLFYGALLNVSGWESMAVTEAAQAVQISAYPDAYAKWEASARAWLTELG